MKNTANKRHLLGNARSIAKTNKGNIQTNERLFDKSAQNLPTTSIFSQNKQHQQTMITHLPVKHLPRETGNTVPTKQHPKHKQNKKLQQTTNHSLTCLTPFKPSLNGKPKAYTIICCSFRPLCAFLLPLSYFQTLPPPQKPMKFCRK